LSETKSGASLAANPGFRVAQSGLRSLFSETALTKINLCHRARIELVWRVLGRLKNESNPSDHVSNLPARNAAF
jgi:hypothetical protein